MPSDHPADLCLSTRLTFLVNLIGNISRFQLRHSFNLFKRDLEMRRSTSLAPLAQNDRGIRRILFLPQIDDRIRGLYSFGFKNTWLGTKLYLSYSLAPDPSCLN